MLGSFRTYSQSPGGRFLLALMFGLLAVSFFIAFGPSGRLFEPTKGADYAAKVNGEIISRVEFERYYYRQVRQFGIPCHAAGEYFADVRGGLLHPAIGIYAHTQFPSIVQSAASRRRTAPRSV